MTASEFLAASRQAAPAVPSQLLASVAYRPAQLLSGTRIDGNAEFRKAVVDALLDDLTPADRALILHLVAEEIACERAIQEHQNLYQLCFHLYKLGELADVFVLYDAKFNSSSWDVSLLLDREFLTLGHTVPVVQRYVQAEFARQPALAAHYPQLLAVLQDLLDYFDYEGQADYRDYLREYFRAQETDPEPSPNPASGYQPNPKKWWQFW